MNMLKKGLSAILAAACLLTSALPVMVSAEAKTTAAPPSSGEEFVVGRFQAPGNVAEKELPGEGFLGVKVAAPSAVNIEGYNKNDLAVRFRYRVTRSDGVTGPGSLKYLQNGHVDIFDSATNRRANFGSPTQNGLPSEQRLAGEWLEVSFQLSAMSDEGTNRLISIEVGDHNDFPKVDGPERVDTGMYLEVMDLRIVDTTKDADGNPLPKYTVTTFTGFSSTYQYNGNDLWWADWKYADVYPVALGDDRSNYRLQMTVNFTSEDKTVNVDECWSNLTIKLRSTDVTSKPDDPDDTNPDDPNSEHNIGWDFTPQNLKMENGTARISIDLSGNATNHRGLIDWNAIERIITIGTVSERAKEKISGITMTLSDVQIVDLQAVASLRQKLKSVIDTQQDTTLFGQADKAAYEKALGAAQTVLADEMSSVSVLQAAMQALQQAQMADDADKAALKAAIDEEIDETAYTEASVQAYTEAKQSAQTVADNAGAPVTAVNAALSALNEAKAALEERELLYGDVDGNGEVQATDALLALKAAANALKLNDTWKARADVDGQESVSIIDALLILQYAARCIDSFPIDLANLTDATLSENPTTFCNPLNLNYEYQQNGNYNGSREAADPALVAFKGKYWLFASHNEGYWYSDDMAQWTYVQVDVNAPEGDPQREFLHFAPATMVIGDYLYLTHSEQGDFIRTQDPTDPTKWESLGRPWEASGVEGWGDPSWMYDDPADGGDGYVYGYEGTGAGKPIIVLKFDPKQDLKWVDGPVDCLNKDPANHGFEVSGEDNTKYQDSPCLEGSWMTRYNGRYYLMYAIPGTEYGSYADGCYVSDSPMGPFEYCENSPVSYKASGFVRGAGHGCLFEDLNGRWWKADTVSISVNGGFERRLDIFPATFKDDGATLENGKPYASLYTNTVQGDYPMYAPREDNDSFENPGPGWQLLSYGKTVTASSTLSRGKAPSKAVDENLKTWWSADTGDVGEWLKLDLGKVYRTRALQVNFADQNTADNFNGRNGDFSYKYLLEFSQDGDKWYTIKDLSENHSETSHDYYEFASKDGVGMRYVRVTNKGAVPQGGKFAISGLRVFGDPVGEKPAAVDTITVDRYPENERSVSLSWDAVPGAQGYIVRLGTKEDSLYNQCQVIGGNGVTLNILSMGVDYYFRVDSYNEGGVTTGTVVEYAPWTVEPTKPSEPDQPDQPDQPDEPDKPDKPIQPDLPQNPDKVDGYPVYEAEEAVLVVANPSDKGHVGNMHAEGATITFEQVDGGDGGNAVLHVVYASGENSQMKLAVNGREIGTFDMVDTGGWEEKENFKMIEIPLDGLTSGETNTIQLAGGHGGFNVDYIQVIYTKA